MATLLLGYDVEYTTPDGTTAAFLERILEVHARWDAPLTLFLLGETIEQNVEPLRRAAASPLVSVGQHTYSHTLLRPLRVDTGSSVTDLPAGSAARIDEELRRTNRLLRDRLGQESVGLTAPYTYFRGLQGHPQLLEVLRRNGVRFVRSDGRDERGYQPVPRTPPYWYDADGYPDILEIPTHGWHDCVVREDVLGWGDLDGYVALVAAEIDAAVAEDGLYSICAHDWSSLRGDPELTHVDRILAHARAAGMDISTYERVYEDLRAARAVLP